MNVSEVSPGGETDLLKLLEVSRKEVDKAQFEAQNPGLKLLVPPGETAQAFVQFEKGGKVWVVGNFNLPVSKEGQDKFPPVFNTPDFGFLMGWVDKEGNWFYHVPLQPGEEGKASVVYQRGDELYIALVDLPTGKIDPKTISPYWRPMPEKAVKAVMAKYGDAVYVTFWRADGTQIGEAIKVCDLPPEPTPTPVCGELTLKPDKEKVNVRAGPGTNYPILETLDPNEKFLVKYRTADGEWMYGDLVDAQGNVKRRGVWVTGSEEYVVITCGKAGIPVIPQEKIPPTPTPRPTETPKPPEISPYLFIAEPDAGNGFRLFIDASTPARKMFYDLMVKTLQEIGFTLRIHGRDRITWELSLEGDAAPGSHDSGCARFGWRIDYNAKTIDAFFFVAEPWDTCSTVEFTDVLANPIGEVKGYDYSWWFEGIAKISSQLGRKLTRDDYPIGASR